MDGQFRNKISSSPGFENDLSLGYHRNMGQYLVLFCLSYIFGSVSFGIIFSRIKGVDPRKAGSGNIGATNVMRTAGIFYGVLTLIFDTLKGFLPVYFAKYMGFPELTVILSGFASFIGHILPITLKFKGGRGVATAFGVFLGLNPYATLTGVLIFTIVVMIWKYVSLGSLLASLSFPFLLYIFGDSRNKIALAAIVVAIIFLKHRDNIRRLVHGKENKLKF